MFSEMNIRMTIVVLAMVHAIMTRRAHEDSGHTDVTEHNQLYNYGYG